MTHWWRAPTEHCTTHFRPSSAALAAATVGRPVALSVLGVVADGYAQAAVVEARAEGSGAAGAGAADADADAAMSALLGAAGANRSLHITMSTAPGVRPAYSNELLGARGYVPLGAGAPPLTLRGVVGVRLAHGGTCIDAAEYRARVLGVAASPAAGAAAAGGYVLSEAAKVYTLNVFDFDGTVAITPDAPR
jgi:hypothetical protein